MEAVRIEILSLVFKVPLVKLYYKFLHLTIDEPYEAKNGKSFSATLNCMSGIRDEKELMT